MKVSYTLFTNGEPMIVLRAQQGQETYSPIEARRLALEILQAATEAECDAAQFQYVREYFPKDDPGKLRHGLERLKEYRTEKHAESLTRVLER